MTRDRKSRDCGGDRKRGTSPEQTMWQERPGLGGKMDEKLPGSEMKDSL